MTTRTKMAQVLEYTTWQSPPFIAWRGLGHMFTIELGGTRTLDIECLVCNAFAQATISWLDDHAMEDTPLGRGYLIVDTFYSPRLEHPCSPTI